ncbi:Brix domain-containing protein [Mycena venus]|uniref:Brix domain-containing protein n=1 Tax=Mycena venus TaxID=2733690 RepID=A0A8H6Y355_9AGAR|nr:Brix domain-containing protein [Mycena venus]
MSSTRFEPSSIKNKIKREEVARKSKKAKGQQKLQKRLAQAKVEANDPAAKKKRLAENVPRTLDNTSRIRPFIPHRRSRAVFICARGNSAGHCFRPICVLLYVHGRPEHPTQDSDHHIAQGDESDKGKGFEVGRIAGWAAGRGYKHMCVVNEDSKKPNAITLIHLPNGPTAYFKLTSVQLTKEIYGHARATPHDPELILNNFVTRLGHAVGRMFQALFPPLPEFQGRQVVTLHNQRDFLFFRRHRYAFRSPEKVALQEIGPRFTLKLRSLRKGIPAVQRFGDDPKPLVFEVDSKEDDEVEGTLEGEGGAAPQAEGEGTGADTDATPKPVVPPTTDEFLWQWKPELETTRKTFFL